MTLQVDKPFILSDSNDEKSEQFGFNRQPVTFFLRLPFGENDMEKAFDHRLRRRRKCHFGQQVRVGNKRPNICEINKGLHMRQIAKAVIECMGHKIDLDHHEIHRFAGLQAMLLERGD
ncbi:hypothetical protein D3C85_1442910 [compost metagenome]